MPLKPCLDCGALSNGPCCPDHRRLVGRARQALRETTTERGYGPAHRAARARIVPAAVGTDCPICGKVMRAVEDIDLDHTDPLSRFAR